MEISERMSGRTVFPAGVVLVALGLLFLAGQQGWIDASGLVSTWWPGILIVAGLAALMSRQGGWSSWLLFCLGVVLLLVNLGILPRSRVMALWPLVLIVVGIFLLIGRMGGGRRV